MEKTYGWFQVYKKVEDHISKRLPRDVRLNQRSKLKSKLFVVTSTTESSRLLKESQ